ncbi:MAG: DnaJ domain-containing protein [Gammaproteobacteria bacterium]|jgi:DnaJ-domain-containing protein 1|nr:DnaJ domain-containing protein [Gammaproteobacteria bacterium]MBT3488729.1 DnaJ domain-containing protein [Gammaproteobacteria bacterium]MBT3717980.1 DnaJ domain-containing protein [Gammaproteobacteria bacterium]MBT3845432.1 DnaJ domain-containing protein [Gammaproteobacteria bacterium]MBT3893939.1 DnaJ domain-containing protein [Gammaproteobacteria bacterium]
MMHNPLIPEILVLLHDHPDGISEYDLIQALEGHAAFKELEEDNTLSLFQIHFLVMNALYTLQQQLWQEEQLCLEVSPLKSFLTTTNQQQSDGAALIADCSNLSGYYCDWDNLEGMTEEEVEQLLDSFWNRFVVEDLRGPALLTLGLEVGCSQQQIIQRYRQLAAAHHPDKGGDPKQFIEIRQAYEVLSV